MILLSDQLDVGVCVCVLGVGVGSVRDSVRGCLNSYFSGLRLPREIGRQEEKQEQDIWRGVVEKNSSCMNLTCI